jgi:hypothetical protein
MSKKDYQAIARALFQAKDGSYAEEDSRIRIIGNLADVFKADNSRFDRERFIEACETGKCKGMK